MKGFFQVTFVNSVRQTVSIVNGENIPMRPRKPRWPHAVSTNLDINMFNINIHVCLCLYICICRLNSEVESIFIHERNVLKIHINKTDPWVSLTSWCVWVRLCIWTRCFRPENELVARRSNSFSFHEGRGARANGAAVNGGDDDDFGAGMGG